MSLVGPLTLLVVLHGFGWFLVVLSGSLRFLLVLGSFKFLVVFGVY